MNYALEIFCIFLLFIVWFGLGKAWGGDYQDQVTTRKFKGKYSERVALVYRYNSEANAQLKETLGWPSFSWEIERKQWSVEDDRITLIKAADILTEFGYECKEMYDQAQVHPSGHKSPGECWAQAEGTVLHFQWPFIERASKRELVMDTVRRIEGRKWDPVNRTWTIPLTQVQVLHGRIESIYPPLGKAIIECDLKRPYELIYRRLIESGDEENWQKIEFTFINSNNDVGILDLYPNKERFERLEIAIELLIKNNIPPKDRDRNKPIVKNNKNPRHKLHHTSIPNELGYNAGKSGLDSFSRKSKLQQIMQTKKEDLPIIGNGEERKWGQAGTCPRLKKLHDFLSSRARLSKNNRRMQEAFEDYIEDINWLKETYYSYYNCKFRWHYDE